MKGKNRGRRQFLKEGAALAGLAVGAGAIRSASGQTVADRPRADSPYGVRSHFETLNRGPSNRSTPLQDSMGIITPSGLHFINSHLYGKDAPDFDPRQHRLLIQGLVDRPLIFTLEELKRLPSVSRIWFIECGGNGSYVFRGRPGSPERTTTAGEAYGAMSCSEWTGVLLSLLLGEAGVQKGARWVIGEGAEGVWTMSLPLEMADKIIVAYGQNGEAVRPEQGYPLRLVAAGVPGDHNVKWLRRILVSDQPTMSMRDSGEGCYPRKDGRNSLFKPQWPVKSLITFPSGGHRLPGRGFYEISGVAWSGGGTVRRVEVSTDGGRSWKDAQLQEPVLPYAWTRFRFSWNWDGEEVVLQSRSTDDQGDVQPTLAEMARVWGSTVERWKATLNTPIWPFNPIQPWKVTREGSVYNALFD